METCICGLKRGDHVIIVGWNGEGSSGCWVGGMKQYVGISDIIYTEWLQKVEPYTLF